ncbi:MAG: OmpA family protein [Candidatus Symbiothrix sp.]|jgi:outer membrane protein OmpA-like peptidoglycan-associated protein|nr:OmpA family protein [Candidatus Symbiothrix sp.]
MLPAIVAAQTQKNPWSVGVYGVKTEYLGDMRVYEDAVSSGNMFNRRVNTIYNFKMFHPGAALSVDHYLSRYFDLGLYASLGSTGYQFDNKANYGYNTTGHYNQTSRNFEVSPMLNINLHTRIKFLGQNDAKWVPYALIGIGGLGYFNISSNVNAVDGDYSIPQDRSNYSTVKNNYKDTPAFTGIISGGLGLEYKLNDQFSIRYQAELGWTTSDEYDMYTVKKGNDWQLQHSLGLVYSFGKLCNKPRPVVQPVIPVIPEPVKEPVFVPEPVKEEPVVEPIKEEPVAEPKKPISVKNALFATGKYAVNSTTAAILKEAIVELKSEETATILIKGHTDNVGQETFNQTLSLKRANAVKNYLIKHGINSARITTEGYGELQPIATNDTPQGRATNRRVEFVIRTE